MTLNGLLTALLWLGIAVLGWLAIAFVVGVFLGRSFRGRNHHYPSPNHPAVRAHKQLTDDKPLDIDEAEKWAQIEKHLSL